MTQASASHEGIVKTTRANRRATIRYRCAPATLGKIVSMDDKLIQRAWIQDLSLRGIGMHLMRPVEPGTLVVITLKSTDNAKNFELAATVMRCDALPHDEWLVGCAFTTPLTPEALDELL